MTESQAFAYRRAVRDRISLDDYRRDTFPVCASDLELVIYSTALTTDPKIETFDSIAGSFQRYDSTPAELDQLTLPGRTYIKTVSLYYAELLEIALATVQLDSYGAMYQRATADIQQVKKDFWELFLQLEDCVLYSIIAHSSNDPLAEWHRQYQVSPCELFDDVNSRLSIALADQQALHQEILEDVHQESLAERAIRAKGSDQGWPYA